MKAEETSVVVTVEIPGTEIQKLQESRDGGVDSTAFVLWNDFDKFRDSTDVEIALGQAQAEAVKLMGEARQRAEAREHEIVDAAKQEAAGMVESARKAIRAEQDKAISAIRAEVVDLAMNAAGQVLERNVDHEDDRRLVSELVRGHGALRS